MLPTSGCEVTAMTTKKETGESVEVSQRMSDDERLLVLRQNTVYHRARKYVDWVFFIALVFIVLVF